ncbi:hypothetical protein THRCLA_08038, partial [Thraustotheca clavata]
MENKSLITPEELLTLLDGYGHEFDAFQRCLTELQRSIQNTPGIREDMAQCNLIPRLMKYFTMHSHHSNLMLCMIHFLQSVVIYDEKSNAEFQSEIVKSGLWRHILDAAKDGNEEIHDEWCKLTSILCYDYPFARHEENQLEMVQSGALDTVVEMIKLRNTPQSYIIGSKTIVDLCYKNVFKATNIDRAIKLDVIVLLSMGLHLFYKDLLVVQGISNVFFYFVMANPEATKNGMIQSSTFDRLQSCLAYPRIDIQTVYYILRIAEVVLRDD